MDLSKNQSANSPRDSSSQEFLSPGSKSRYGRTRRPKISHDFYDIDSVIIDENPVSDQIAPVVKSPKLKSPIKPSVIGREILFEIKDEFTQLDDLGMKVANNFKTNLQRGLDDSIKERKFFKSMNENKVDVPNVVDVSKVFKLISAKSGVLSDVYEKKVSPKSALKTYSNKRKHVHDGDNFVVESFGLPDEPIIPVNSPFSPLERNNKIDVDVNIQSDVNLPNPWSFDEYQTVPICLGDSITTMEELNGNSFSKSNVLDLFSYDSLLSENSEIENASLKCLNKLPLDDQFRDIPHTVKNTAIKNNKNIRNRETKNTNRKPKYVKKQKNQIKFVDKVKIEETINLENERDFSKNSEISIIEESDNPPTNKLVDCTECDTTDIIKNATKIETKNNETLPGTKKRNRTNHKLPEMQNRRILRSNVDNNITITKDSDLEKTSSTKNDSSSIINISDTSSEDSLIDLTNTSSTLPEKQIDFLEAQRSPCSNSSITEQPEIHPNPETPKLESGKQVINPASLAQTICNTQVRVILNPLACIRKLPEKFVEKKTLVPNPFKQKEEGSLKQKRKLRSFARSTPFHFSDTVVKIKRNILKKHEWRRLKKQNDNKEDVKKMIDVKSIKTEMSDYSVGDLTWAKIGNYPYWPCMITEEPISGNYKKILTNRSHPLYHVRFFGDNGRRSWVSAHRMMLYCGKDDLDHIAKVLKAEGKVKSAFIKESYTVNSRNLVKWQIGVEEAESLKGKNVEKRLHYFFEVFANRRQKIKKELEDVTIKEEMLDISDQTVPIIGKRTRLSEDDNPKKPKSVVLQLPTEVSLQNIQDIKIKQELEENQIIELESPKKGVRKLELNDLQNSPKKTANKKTTDGKIENEDSAAESCKRILRNSQQKEPNEDQEINHQRKKLRNSLSREEQKKPKTTPSETSEENGAETRKKSKRNSVENIPSQEQSEENEEYSTPKLRNKRHGENSDTDSKISDNSSVPASLEAQAALHRRNNIFRGIPKEKICQICEKPGDVFKCKGPCNGVYHYSCAVSENQTKEDSYLEETSTDESMQIEQSPDNKSNVEIISVNSKKPLPNLSTSPNFKGMSLAEKIDFRMKEIMKKFDYQSVYSESTDSSSEEFIMDESFEKNEKGSKLKSQSKLSLTVTCKPTKKEVPIIKHVTADNINYICVTNEQPKDKVMTELIKDTLKHLRCTWCSTGQIAPCLVCNKEESKLGSKFRQKCSLHQCGKYYHPECLKTWPQTQWSLIQSTKDKKSDASYDTFVCPRHVCHTCISDDPRAANSRCPSDKVVKCLRCPATYHSSNYCVPAGTEILTSSQIVCPRHFSELKSSKKRKFQQTINTNWCLICSKGGDLICCETCPTSVHVECLPGGQNPDDIFYCEDCQSGRLPLYDEIVWVKLGTFRWWPALILFPNEIPDNVRNIKHDKGEFVVKFFGTYDHYWVGRGRTFLFQEGDKGHSNSVRKRVDNAFAKAVEEAAAAHQLKKQFKGNKMAEKSTALKPPPYIRIKVNKPVGNVRQFDANTSNTTSCDCDPNQPHPCGPDSDCLNRLLLTECNPEVCPAGERCNNQCFEKREYPPLEPHHTQERGWGLKTLAPIRKGQFVIEYVGEMIDEQEYQRRIQKMHEQKEENYYFLTIDKDRTLDAGPKGNVARFMNHSCQPNCETQKWTVNGDTRVGLFAKCDIPAGTELTFNYNLECIGKEKKICKCGAPNCSGFIGVKVKSEGNQKKSSKPRKKKSPPPPPPDIVIKDDPCFVCGKTGDVGACNNKICTKYYHLQCAGLASWPEGGKWVCQWHNCNICSKRTFRCCVKCVNSYCPSHSQSNIRYDKLLGFLCSEHDPTKQLIETVVKKEELVEEGAVLPIMEEETTNKREGNRDDSQDSVNLDQRLNGSIAPLLVKENETKIKKKKGAKKVEEVKKNHTANEVKLSNVTPVKYLRTRKNGTESLNRTDPEKDLPIRKRTRLRCGNNF